MLAILIVRATLKHSKGLRHVQIGTRFNIFELKCDLMLQRIITSEFNCNATVTLAGAK
jgi:hypothetical protein